MIDLDKNGTTLLTPSGAFNGFVHLESTWGDEATIIDTARVSTSNDRRGTVENLTDRDKNLLKFLYEHDHGTPFETVYFRYRIVAPIFVLRQFVKHRISSWNEFSMRYREPLYEFYKITQDANPVLTEEEVLRLEEVCKLANDTYKEIYDASVLRIEANGNLNVAEKKALRARSRELCRTVITVAEFSDVYWTINARSLFNFFEKRLPEDAQYEARMYAEVMYKQFKEKFPLLAEVVSRR